MSRERFDCRGIGAPFKVRPLVICNLPDSLLLTKRGPPMYVSPFGSGELGGNATLAAEP